MGKYSLFRQLDEAFNEYEYSISDVDRFKLMLEYQANHLSNISKAANHQTQKALERTSMYEIDTAIKRWKKNKSNKMLFRLINIVVISYDNIINNIVASEITNKSSNNYETEALNIFKENKKAILSEKDWYLYVIPESKQLIDYLETLQD